MGLFNNIKFFVLCHGILQLAQLLVSGYLKGSISTIERRYGLSSQKSGLLASFNEVGNTVLIVFVSYFGSRVHRPKCIGIGAIIASMASFLIALPHFISGKYHYTDDTGDTTKHVSGLCQAVTNHQAASSNQTCQETQSPANNAVFPILLLGQLLLGIGAVPIQPFGISYIDDYANKNNSPFYLGILFALTVIGPALGYLLGSILLRFYVDFNTMSPAEIVLERKDPRWVGAWWLGFLLAGTLLFLTSLPYLFFPRSIITEETVESSKESQTEKLKEKQEVESDTTHDLSLLQFLKKFPNIMLRTMRNPIYLFVVLAQVNLSAMVAGLATFMPKYIERQFTQTAAFSNIMIGGLNIPSAILGIMAGGTILRRYNLSVKASAILCSSAVLLSIVFALPLLFLGCPTQNIAGINPANSESFTKYQNCSLICSCSDEAFNPVCGSDGVEFRSPCHAGCKIGIDNLTQNYTECACVGPVGSQGYAVSGKCGKHCSHLLIPFMFFSSLTCFLASLSQTPSFMMILRTVMPEDKSFALGIQFMLFRVLAFLPAPVLYGSAIDSTCILWGKKCNKNTSCHYYNLNFFRQRFLGLQIFFLFGGLVFFMFSFLVLKRMHSDKQNQEKMNICTNEKQKLKDFTTKSLPFDDSK
ncbi:solute carrier organic anion transporter family member 2B1 [Neoarius graeffei]|uniref:solute carrier organic anion transporter family member 2B1 n=1 Tax=Neoarius graeffei TaxID=443677 RepID=UPI00298D54D5|nr:solute carrier organic anion transporter family member 2B1 [Neoarius graeffei]XP_060792393.1 solute carrier organic anion transporter family member 2B1 [Neoarius graeffei]XP_060792394.1 solute carrier organic anion transporter family member 2B1 [Neoarius graeffei]XP_060792395.1 solute carrier organic anion transporter family member 2B1 [Neoarius graeffei]